LLGCIKLVRKKFLKADVRLYYWETHFSRNMKPLQLL
jgi:hypothetical protein